MKLFQPLRKMMPFLVGYDNLQGYGLVAPNTYWKYFCSFTHLMGYVVLVTGTVLVGAFLIIDAKTFEEFSEHFYEFATGLNDTFYFILMKWLCKQIFELSEKYEEIIEKRESVFFLNPE